MFEGFSPEALEFLLGIRLNNNKDWFEPRKKIYTEKIYSPMKELGEEIYRPFADMDGMMCKVGRIYRDESFPPYLHYRDTLFIYVRRNAMNWSKTPTLFFELSPEGAEFGFRVSSPSAAVMERFRSDLTEDPRWFTGLFGRLEADFGIELGGDEYKRKKKCPVPELERFFAKKGLSASVKVKDRETLFSRRLSERTVEIFKAVMPIYEYFCELIEIEETSKLLLEESVPEDTSTLNIVKAPDVDFMW